jgi:hypothetical protein
VGAIIARGVTLCAGGADSGCVVGHPSTKADFLEWAYIPCRISPWRVAEFAAPAVLPIPYCLSAEVKSETIVTASLTC